jgi:hypothetical protein
MASSHQRGPGSGGSGASGGGGNEAEEGSGRTWGSYVPGTGAAHNAAEYWAAQLAESGGAFFDDPLAATGLFFAVLWTEANAIATAATLSTGGIGSLAKGAMGPMQQWVRIGSSYSHAAGQRITLSLRWGRLRQVVASTFVRYQVKQCSVSTNDCAQQGCPEIPGEPKIQVTYTS